MKLLLQTHTKIAKLLRFNNCSLKTQIIKSRGKLSTVVCPVCKNMFFAGVLFAGWELIILLHAGIYQKINCHSLCIECVCVVFVKVPNCKQSLMAL